MSAMEKSREIELSTANRRLLASLLRQRTGAPEEQSGVDATRFRATHHEAIGRLDWLEAAGYLRREDGRYVLSLTALAELSSPEARSLIRDARAIYRHLRAHYIAVQQQEPARLTEISERTGIPLDRVVDAVACMVEAPWWGGRTTNMTQAAGREATITPAESVLTIKDFRDWIEQLRSWQRDRVNGRPQMTVAVTSENPLDIVETAREPVNEPEKKRASRESATPEREVPIWLQRVPRDIKRLVLEVYAARGQELRWLAAIGLRGVVEVVAVKVVGDLRTYGEKLEALQRNGFISQLDVRVLSAVVEVGNASAHRGYSPGVADLDALFDAVERLVHGFVLDPAAKRARRNAPSRPSRKAGR